MTDVQLGITLLVLFVASLVGYGLGYRNEQISGELLGLKQRLAKKRQASVRKGTSFASNATSESVGI